LGLQVIGQLDDDQRTLRAAHWIQQRMAYQPFSALDLA
jgi:Asp-tRNA(Asn)/Glu-tRNA(Gln) amidotransferase A subunit family amidase